MSAEAPKSVAVVGAGIFGLSLAVALREKGKSRVASQVPNSAETMMELAGMLTNIEPGHNVTVFDRHPYNETAYNPNADDDIQAASVDHNKIFRASYGSKLHYQRLALESRELWTAVNKNSGDDLFVPSGMLRVQPTEELSQLEKETLANMERDGIRDTQFVKSSAEDRARAAADGWESKLLDFKIPNSADKLSYEAVLDSLAGFMRCADACAYFQKLAASKGVAFHFGPEEGACASLVEEDSTTSSEKKRVVGIKTKNGKIHKADVVAVAAGSHTTQVLPDLSYHLESSAGSIATFKIDKNDTELWDKYSPEEFPVVIWKNKPRSNIGTDTGSIYVLPRTAEGLVKIGYRGVKFTNFRDAPEGCPYTQDGKWSVPLPPQDCLSIPEPAAEAVRDFVSIFMPDFVGVPFYSTKLCWYTDSLDNSFVIDYVPTYADNSVFVCTGGSGHGAKFLPVLGKHAADILENGDKSTSPLRPFWRWRADAPRRNGLEEGPKGPRNIGQSQVEQ